MNSFSTAFARVLRPAEPEADALFVFEVVFLPVPDLLLDEPLPVVFFAVERVEEDPLRFVEEVERDRADVEAFFAAIYLPIS